MAWPGARAESWLGSSVKGELHTHFATDAADTISGPVPGHSDPNARRSAKLPAADSPTPQGKITSDASRLTIPVLGDATGDPELPAVDSPASQDKVTSGPSQFTVHMPVDARGVALGILATLALVFALQWAQNFAISLVLGIFLAYTLNPLVVWLERIKVPRVVGAAMVILAVLCGLGLATYSLRGQMQTIVDQLPEAARKLTAQ